jgi:hypothetical protein
MQKLVLYSGAHCHLCDQAFSLLKSVSPEQLHLTEKVDVASSHQLYHAYGARIPVFKRVDTGAELAWPFDEVQLTEFIS